ncbi:MAG TPA: ABC transporter ATP-binding protein [Candidatus Saccharimonadia bacterium]|nr:ABC transporter ATP-binding protein [Candidatus Saccharimonadia bacterium]
MTLSQKNNTDTKRVISYYLRCVRAYPRAATGILLVIPITILINSYLPALILANVLSRLSQHHYQNGHLWASFGPQIVLYAALLITGIAAWRLVDVFVWYLEQHVQTDIAQHVFRHLLSRSADFHANNFSGSLVSQANKLTGGYVRMADTTYFQVYGMVSGIVIAATILSFRAPLYAVILVAYALIYLSLSFSVSRPVRRLSSKHAAQESRQTGFLADAITNAMAIKSFAHTEYEKKRFARVTQETEQHLRLFAHAHRWQMNRLGVMNRTISALALLIAVVAVMQFHANIGTVFLIFNYTATIVDQLFNFSNSSLRNYNRAIGDAADITAILAEEPEVKDPVEPETLRMHAGAINFKNVRFSHTGADDPVFSKLNLRIKPGEKIGLVGHSGSGKSTLMRVLMRFSDIQGGEVLIDSQNIANVTQDDLHTQIAYVPQEPLLFHRSIRENIAYGQLDASKEAIEAAAKMASAHDFIMDLPDGYDTLVGERGVKLSGGQRQRVVIARAMLKNAPILALDEATSALDSESEVLIQAALWKLMEGRTAIVIAHRLSTIQKMDRILVLDKGKIVEEGTHKELIGQNGTYAKLWAHQSGGFMDD